MDEMNMNMETTMENTADDYLDVDDAEEVMDTNPASSILRKGLRVLAGGAIAGGVFYGFRKLTGKNKKTIERPVHPVGDVLVGRRPKK